MADRWRCRADDAQQASALRRGFRKFVRAAALRPAQIEAAELAVSELVGNVLRHAPGPLEITAEIDSEGNLAIDVTDTGGVFALAPMLPSDPFLTSGRGLYLIAALGAELSVTPLPHGKRVRAVFANVTSAYG